MAFKCFLGRASAAKIQGDFQWVPTVPTVCADVTE